MRLYCSNIHDVEQVVVVVREDTPGDKRLVAYVVAAPASLPDFAALRNWVKEQLPEYMVPVAWVEMPSLPLTPNGKVDRKNLPAPEYQRAELAGEYQEARTPAEEVMAGIWAEVLKLDQVGSSRPVLRAGRTLPAGHAGSVSHPARLPGGTAVAGFV